VIPPENATRIIHPQKGLSSRRRSAFRLDALPASEAAKAAAVAVMMAVMMAVAMAAAMAVQG